MSQNLIWYYLDGWRVGVLVSNNGHSAIISPIAARGGAVPRNVKVSSDDVKLVEGK